MKNFRKTDKIRVFAGEQELRANTYVMRCLTVTMIVYLITLSCTIAFFLPAASAASCVMFANTKWVRAKDVYKYSVPTIIMMSVIAVGWNIIMFMF